MQPGAAELESAAAQGQYRSHRYIGECVDVSSPIWVILSLYARCHALLVQSNDTHCMFLVHYKTWFRRQLSSLRPLGYADIERHHNSLSKHDTVYIIWYVAC